MGAGVVETERLCHPLAFVITGANTVAINIALVIFSLGVDKWISVDLTC